MAAIPLVEDGFWRVIVSMPPGVTGPDEPGIEDFERAIAQRANIVTHVVEPRWLTGFTVRQNMVTQFRKGRVLLAGDAAGNHSPVGGQGMNTGLQDAHNLDWKLALAVQGVASEALLDSYDAERKPLAAQILKATGLATRIVTLHRRPTQIIRNRIARALTGLKPVRERLVSTLSELNICYDDSPIVADRMGAISHLKKGVNSNARVRSDGRDALPKATTSRRS